jgi:hypothetical protein
MGYNSGKNDVAMTKLEEADTLVQELGEKERKVCEIHGDKF